MPAGFNRLCAPWKNVAADTSRIVVKRRKTDIDLAFCNPDRPVRVGRDRCRTVSKLTAGREYDGEQSGFATNLRERNHRLRNKEHFHPGVPLC
jgi:hypothetical protein